MMMMTTATEPRAGSQTLNGLPWLARMTDKARLDADHQIEAFDLVYNCPMDKQCLAKLRLSAEAFQALAVANRND
jgi:hypothetical protein